MTDMSDPHDKLAETYLRLIQTYGSDSSKWPLGAWESDEAPEHESIQFAERHESIQFAERNERELDKSLESMDQPRAPAALRGKVLATLNEINPGSWLMLIFPRRPIRSAVLAFSFAAGLGLVAGFMAEPQSMDGDMIALEIDEMLAG